MTKQNEYRENGEDKTERKQKHQKHHNSKERIFSKKLCLFVPITLCCSTKQNKHNNDDSLR